LRFVRPGRYLRFVVAHYVMANPPFGGSQRNEIQHYFPIRTGEIVVFFLQHFIKMLKAGGRGAGVIKNTFLSNTDNASVSLRKLLLESRNLHKSSIVQRHLTRRGRENRRASLREGNQDAQNLVPQSGSTSLIRAVISVKPIRRTTPLSPSSSSCKRHSPARPKSWTVDAKAFDPFRKKPERR